jgi:dipeptidase E
LLHELIKTGADKIIVEQINSGKLYIGESAGSMIVSPNVEYVQGMDSIKKAPELETLSALSVIDFYPLPHYTNFPFKKAVEKIIAQYETDLKLYPISNSQAILVNGNDVVVSGND